MASYSSKTPRDDSPGEGAQQYKVARAISSCTRCRSRKSKCDGKLPKCSACERAKVECIGFDAISKTNISRTHLHSLEQELAELRAQLAAYQEAYPDAPGPMGSGAGISRSSATPAPAFRPPTPRNDSQSLTIDPALTQDYDTGPRSWDSPNAHAQALSHAGAGFPSHIRRQSEHLSSPHSPSLSSAMNPKSQALTRMVHDAALRTGHAVHQANAISAFNAPGGFNGSDKGSVAFSPEDASSPQMRPPRQGSISTPNGQGYAPLAHGSANGSESGRRKKAFSIPPLPPQPAIERLVAAYVDFVGVTAPIIHIPTLGKQLQKIRDGRDVEESDVFVVMMVLALSTMASARFVELPDELRACSEAFHAEAMKHLDPVFEEQSYVSLQAILLLVWYSLLNPEKGSIWFLVGLATRTCVDMGYHNEHNVQVDQLDALEMDMRRRLFWCTYKMDRLMSGALGRPPSIPDGFINVPLPSLLHDVDLLSGNYGPSTGSNCAYKAVFVHTIKARQLQSEILSHTFGIHGSPEQSRAWADDCYERLKEWLATTPEPRGAMSNEGFATAYHNTVLLLFRPSPGNPRPDRKALANVMASSSYIIRIYRRMQLNNRISWLWMTSHFCFMAGLSFLYAILNMHHTGAGGMPTLDEAVMDVESCMATLQFLSPRVPSAAACHDTMRHVSSAIFEQLRQAEAKSSPSASTGRGVLNRAPVSSSRDDPLPNTELAALPAVTLPYELSLLDNLFVNPMASHKKASDYTQGAKGRVVAAEVRNAFAGHYDASRNKTTNGKESVNSQGIGPWQMAAGVKSQYGECPTVEQSLAGRVRRASMNRAHNAQSQAQNVTQGQAQGPEVYAGFQQPGVLKTPTGMNGYGTGDMSGMLDPTLVGMEGFGDLPVGATVERDQGSGMGMGPAMAPGTGTGQAYFDELNRSHGLQSIDSQGQGVQGQGQGNGQGQGQVVDGFGLEGVGDGTFDIFSFLDEGFVADAGLDGMAIWS